MKKIAISVRRFHKIMKCLGFRPSKKDREREAWNYRRHDGVHVIAIVNGDSVVIEAHKDIVRLSRSGKYVSSHNVDKCYNENEFFEEFERFFGLSNGELLKKIDELSERLTRIKRAKERFKT